MISLNNVTTETLIFLFCSYTTGDRIKKYDSNTRFRIGTSQSWKTEKHTYKPVHVSPGASSGWQGQIRGIFNCYSITGQWFLSSILHSQIKTIKEQKSRGETLPQTIKPPFKLYCCVCVSITFVTTGFGGIIDIGRESNNSTERTKSKMKLDELKTQVTNTNWKQQQMSSITIKLSGKQWNWEQTTLKKLSETFCVNKL